MNILLWIIFGGLAGWLASIFTASRHNALEDVVIGIIGGFAGGLLMNSIGKEGITGFNLYSLFVAVIGAVILIFLVRILHV